MTASPLTISPQQAARDQGIVRQGLTPEYLQYKGIEATMKIAESPNAKVIVVGGGKGGLPLVFQP